MCPVSAEQRRNVTSIRSTAGRLLLIGMTAASIPFSFLRAPFPEELVLQHVPTVIAIVAVAWLTCYREVSAISFFCMLAFLWVHILGARWIYSFVPYDTWTSNVMGISLSEQFGWERNHYDRFVHFASGILGVPVASELLQRVVPIRPKPAAILAISIVISVGACYEILEWLLAVFLSPEQAEAYNGQQGDIWDPQKDLALASLGSIVAAVCISGWEVSLTPHPTLSAKNSSRQF